MKRTAVILLLLVFAILSGAAEEENAWDAVIGQTAPDITLICADGTDFSLYQALADKELAVVCLFGSDCGACRVEMRALEMAWRLYRDRVAVVGLSLIRYDTPEVLVAFAKEMNITFPLGRDPSRTAKFMKINTYPAFMIVKPDGEVAYIEVNGEASIDHFVALFDTFLDGDGVIQASKTASAVDGECTDGYCPLPEDTEQD